MIFRLVPGSCICLNLDSTVTLELRIRTKIFPDRNNFRRHHLKYQRYLPTNAKDAKQEKQNWRSVFSTGLYVNVMYLSQFISLKNKTKTQLCSC